MLIFGQYHVSSPDQTLTHHRRVNINRGQDPGRHEATVLLTATDVLDSPQQVDIVAMVLAPPGTDAQAGDSDAGPSPANGSTAPASGSSGCSTGSPVTSDWAILLAIAALWRPRRRAWR
jgi:uncharacterized protein (TIGR03382 family)